MAVARYLGPRRPGSPRTVGQRAPDAAASEQLVNNVGNQGVELLDLVDSESRVGAVTTDTGP